MKPSIIFFYSANDYTGGYLEYLASEVDELKGIFMKIGEEYAYGRRHVEANAQTWIRAFEEHQKQIEIFHYGGHATSEALQFVSEDGGKLHLQGHNLQILLRKCDRLRFVFLNACKTLAHARLLLAEGVPAVLVSKTVLRDSIAHAFSPYFYRALQQGFTLKEAFEQACVFVDPEGKAKNKRIYTAKELQHKLKWEMPAKPMPKGVQGLYWKNQPSKKEDGEPTELEYLLCVQNEEAFNWKLTERVSHAQYLSAFTPINTSLFVGREKELAEIQAFLSKGERVLLVNGMGGIGKTSLAKYYVQKYGFKYDHIIWVDVLPERNKAGGDVLSAFVSYQNNILNHLKLSFPPKTPDRDKFYTLMARLGEMEGNNLLVIDNAGEKIIEVQEHLPKAPRWKTLVTSRNSFARFKVYSLDILPKEDAQALFLQYYPQAKEDSLLPLLLKRIGYHTLTIELLAKTLHSHKRLTLPALWKAIDAEGLQAANRKKVSIDHPVFKTPIKANDCVLKLFDIDLLSKEEISLLLQFAVLPPMALAYTLLTDLLAIENEAEDDFMELLDELAQKGWLTTKEDTYSCLQIIQEAVRQQTPPTVENCESLIESISSKLSIDQTKDNPIDKFPWVPYGKSLIQWIEANTKEASSTLALLRSNLGLVLYLLGDYQGAKEQLEAALESDLSNFGENHLNVATRRSNLGGVLLDLGDYQGAKEQLQAALESAIRNFGENHPNVATSRSNLGLVLLDLGDYQGAKEQLEAALESDLRNFGANHPTVATRLSNLGLVLSDLGDYQGAKEQLEAALESDLRNFGANHPKVATRLSNLGLLLLSLGDYQGAKEQLEAALASDLRNFGENHPQVAIYRSNLGNVLSDLGDYQGAKEQLEAALESDLRNFGENHPSVAITSNNLAHVYLGMKESRMALVCFEKAHAIFLYSLGEQHPHTIQVAQAISSLKS